MARFSPKILVVLLGVGITLTSGYLYASSRKTELPVSTAPLETQTTSEATSPDSVDIAMFINQENGVAIEGTDPVAYFTEGAPQAGSSEFQAVWQGATWHFASAENRDLFEADPEKYAPQYGGYCAWAASQGYVAEIDPNAWSIVDGLLYLNFNESIRRRWEKNIPQFIADANLRWPEVVRENS